jgi:hypothetical protein
VCVPVSERVTPYTGAVVTWKLTSNDCAVMALPPDTVTVAVYVPAARPVLGTTVKVPVPPAAMLAIDVVDSVKLFVCVPDSAAVKAPVA